jgi:UDP-N-acetylglucosamine diphosphorylase / glucose-1-phosphate thymidylyltransferase / UDP-N-acetylgalactosamine diphosphorylase / glucosamine-1-phosphate N-acetyltransferase / galactosamine-1-phosphate N-acetyltransferase
MKALILAGGRGNRLNELSGDQNKCMIKINDKPAINYNLDYALSVKVDEIVVVVGYKAETVINHLGNNYRGTPIRYVIQQEQKGLVHALQCSQNTLGGDDFFLMLGDEILQNPGHEEMLAAFLDEKEAFCYCGVVKVNDRNLIKRTYTLIQGANNEIYRLIEKPRNPLNDFQGTGQCIFKNAIFDYIDFTPIHHERNEKELPDLIQCAIDDGRVVKSYILCDRYTNINTYDDIIMAQSFFEA